MISAEISQVQSCQQDQGGVSIDTTGDLQSQANQTQGQIELYETILEDLDIISINCGNTVIFSA